MSDEAVVLDPRLNHTVRLHGMHLHVIVKDETTGTETEGVIHLQHTGKVGMSKPYWAHSQDIAIKCLPVLQDAINTLIAVASDPDRWPTFEQEQAGHGQDPVPEENVE